MPSGKCFIVGCENKITFRFPKDESLREKWLEAIRAKQQPKSNHGLCLSHFREDDFVTEGFYSGVTLSRKRLKRGVIPSVFHWDECQPPKRVRNTQSSVNSCAPCDSQGGDDHHHLEISALPLEVSIHYDSDSDVILPEECKSVNSSNKSVQRSCETLGTSHSASRSGSIIKLGNAGSSSPLCVDASVQTVNKPQCLDICVQTIGKSANYSVHDYKNRPDVIKYFTGLESYAKFMLVFQSLGPDVNHITYRYKRVVSISAEDQFFLTLWKLKKNPPDYELGLHFGVCQATVSNIFVSFIKFITHQWEKIDIWPSKALVDCYMPEDFKKSYAITKSSNFQAQQAIFSNDKDTVKFPEQNQKSESNDSVVADNVPQLTATNISDKNHLQMKSPLSSKNLAEQIALIKRLLGFTKSYRIVTQKLQKYYAPIASEIFFVCLTLCDFRQNNVEQKC